jgi:hypothetical protein
MVTMTYIFRLIDYLPFKSTWIHVVFCRVRAGQSLFLCLVFCRLLFVFLYLFFWSLCCLVCSIASDYPVGIFKPFNGYLKPLWYINISQLQ